MSQGLQISDAFSLQILPQICAPETLSITSIPDVSDFVSLDSASMNFQIQTTDMAHVDVYLVTVTATIPIETAPDSGIYISDSFNF